MLSRKEPFGKGGWGEVANALFIQQDGEELRVGILQL